MGNKLFKVRPGLWKEIRKEIYEREKGICQKCGLSVKEHPKDPDFYPGTDEPTWTIHHIVSQAELQRQARAKCEHLSGQEYIARIRGEYTTLAINRDNLELRCERPECRLH